MNESEKELNNNESEDEDEILNEEEELINDIDSNGDEEITIADLDGSEPLDEEEASPEIESIEMEPSINENLESTEKDEETIESDFDETETREEEEELESTETEVTRKEDLEAQIRNQQRNLIEGALYASGRPLDVEELSTKLEIPKKITEELLNELAFEYLERSSALIINQVGEKYQMALRTEYVEKVSKFATGGGIAERYLRTLTIIALKQPILKSTVIKLRGSGAYEHVKYLLDNEFISAVKKGRTHELSTTDKYSEMFGLPKNKQELKKMMIEQLGIQEKAIEKEESPEPYPEHD